MQQKVEDKNRGGSSTTKGGSSEHNGPFTTVEDAKSDNSGGG